MKIFGKRKRKVEDTNETSQGIFKSDPVVEELLKQDPSTWNSKQRRMIKRYQDRKSTETTSDEQEDTLSQNEQVQQDDARSEVSSDNSGDSEQSSSAPPSTTENKVELTDEILESENPVENINAKNDIDNNTDNNIGEKELQELLNKLNAKQRRTLSRKLERGSTTAQEVHAEALELLGITPDSTNARDGTDEPAAKKSKNGCNKVDWSDLPAEERMRREEQRRKQREAAERRERGESSSHRHPLNSERRRANRRKPKFARKLAPKGGTITQATKHQ